MLKYKIKKENSDILDTEIIQTGGKLELTPRQLKSNIDKVEKFLKEIEAKQSYYEAVMKNIEDSDPEVKDLSEKVLTAAFLYREAMGFVNEALKKSLELREALESDKKALEDIKSQCNLKF